MEHYETALELSAARLTVLLNNIITVAWLVVYRPAPMSDLSLEWEKGTMPGGIGMATERI